MISMELRMEINLACGGADVMPERETPPRNERPYGQDPAAADGGQLLELRENLLALLAKTSSPIDEASIRELVGELETEKKRSTTAFFGRSRSGPAACAARPLAPS